MTSATVCTPVRRLASTRMPLAQGLFTAVGYLDERTGDALVALTMGQLGTTDVLVRLHSECLTGDAFGSLRCDCGSQLESALAAIAAHGSGVVVYIRGHEGRGIGLLDKLRAYQLQDTGTDSVEANLALGLPADAHDYAGAAAVLADLGVQGLRLITNKYGEWSAFSENWPNRAREWLPMIDHPSDKATSEFIVTTAAKYQVVANGLLVETIDLGDGRRVTHWKQSVPIASWLNAIGVEQFGWKDRLDDVFDDLVTNLSRRGFRRVLRGNDDGIDSDGLGSIVFHADLRLTVRPEEARNAGSPGIGQPLCQFVSEENRQRHQFR